MALINCPECGKEVSSLAKSCPNCGYGISAENLLATDNTTKHNTTFDFITKNKKISIGVVIFILVIILVAFISGNVLNSNEKKAYNNAKYLQSIMKNPDAFKVYDEDIYLYHHIDGTGKNDYDLMLMKYGSTNGYGAMVSETAIFKDDRYIMNTSSDVYDGNSKAEIGERISVMCDLGRYGNIEMGYEIINPKKIMKKINK